MCNLTLGQLLRSEGSTIVSMLGMFIGTLVNILLNPIFVFILEMGIRGSPIATVLGNAISLIYSYYSMYEVNQ